MDDTQTTEVIPASLCRTMQDVRQEVDRLDRDIVALIARRSTYMSAAARIKTSRDGVHDDARIADVLAKVSASARQHDMPVSIARATYEALVAACIAYEFEQFDGLRKTG
jgi:isochorismate pyruvate lyase